jgi:hypothetical protein
MQDEPVNKGILVERPNWRDIDPPQIANAVFVSLISGQVMLDFGWIDPNQFDEAALKPDVPQQAKHVVRIAVHESVLGDITTQLEAVKSKFAEMQK